MILGPIGYWTAFTELANRAFEKKTKCRLLAEDEFLPSGFTNLGRRLVYSTGIVVLAVLSAVLLIGFQGITDRLIPLFAVGAFGAFTFSQAGMIVHWLRRPKEGNFSLVINVIGAITTGTALVVIIMAKFAEEAWVTIALRATAEARDWEEARLKIARKSQAGD